MDALLEELLALERRSWERMGTPDPDLEATFGPDFVAIDARGLGLHARDEALAVTRNATVKEFRISQPQLRRPTDDSALVTYRIDATVVLSGKTIPWHALSTGLWVKRDGSWMKVFYQSTRAADS